jgi:hypothetical protein
VKKLVIEDGLLLTNMELTFKGQSLNLQRVLILGQEVQLYQPIWLSQLVL